jgi:excisionase family DNA binding protein
MPELATRRAVTVAEAAHQAHTSTKLIYQLINDRQLPAVKVGAVWRIRQEDLDALLAGRSEPHVDPRIAGIVAAAPPLTDEQVDAIVAIIRADQGGAA